MNKIFFCTIKELRDKSFLVKFVDEIQDELIAFIEKKDGIENIKIFSSICPHFGGEIFYDFKNSYLRCKLHDWKFCPNTGKCLSYPVKTSMNPYDFEVTPQNLNVYEKSIDKRKIYINLKKNEK